MTGFDSQERRNIFSAMLHSFVTISCRKSVDTDEIARYELSGVQLILAYSWARSAILVAGKGREVMFLFLLLFLLFLFFPCPSLSFLLLSLLFLFSLSLRDDTK